MSALGRTSIAVLLVGTFIAGVLSATVGANWFDLGDRVGTPASAAPTENTVVVPPTVSDFQEAFVTVAEAVTPAVV